MRKKYRIIIVMLALTMMCSTSSCRSFSNQGKQEVPSREKAKKNYYVAPFESIDIHGVANVTFSQSDKVKVEVSGPENYLPYVVIESHDGVLNVNTRKIGNKRIGKGLEIKIEAPTLKRLSNRGVGDFKTTSPLRTDTLHIDNSGVGDIRLDNLNCKQLTIHNRSVGDMYLSGKAEQATYQSKGVGDIRAKEMKTNDVTLEHNGVGDVECHASKTIRISSKGVGNVKYYGKPQVLGIEKSGVGSLKSE